VRSDHVITVYQVGQAQDVCFIAMELLEGESLDAWLGHTVRPPLPEALRVGREIALALAAAHARGLVHRDIKPANVLLAGDHVYLTDFGLGRAVEAATRLTDSNDWLGTVDFCSPEQLRCEHVDARSDVYSLACLLQTTLTGTPPHHRDTTAATMLAHLNDPPPEASRTAGVPPALDQVLARALAKRPEGRYASAGELARAARAASEPVPATASAVTRPSRRSSRPAHETVASRTRRLSGWRRTRLDMRPRRPAPRRATATRGAVVALVGVVVALAGAVAALSATSSRAAPPGPLSRVEMTRLVQSFARDYGRRDAAALGSLLAPGIVRVDARSIDRGRPAVLATYRSQLADGSVVGYRLAGLQLTPGWTGRASAQYAILRIGRATITGRVSFGIERIGRRPEIALIAIRRAG